MLNKINKKIINSTLGILAFLLLVIALPKNAQASFFYGSYPTDYTYNTDRNYNYVDHTTDYNNYNTAKPIIYSITPNQVMSGSDNVIISINGTNFAPGSSARLNSYDRQTNYYNSNRMSMIIPASDLREHGTFYVTVFNPSSGLISDSYPLTVNRLVPFTTTTTVKTAPVVKNVSSTTTKKTATTVKKVSEDNTVDAEKDSNDNGLSANALFGANGFLPTNLLQWLILAILVLIIIVLFRKAYLSEEDKSPHNLKHA